ncbi:MAG: SDR family oxidoreductase [Pseudomonadota bacterium]|nr:SDR family oxidoreductase [Pseudomonadota bacterium]MEC7830577.1 SDR family oxidoreductase [Pseudomonadota bacterium]MEC9382545.1 SDR family oxidoreductase [Pseudomonadota bacterium]MEC9481301.1 SDR family oxidoreductase [Pseudomonadota bacterium]
MSRFEGKFAVISGGASGMGAATAKRFVEEGGVVITLDINKELGNKISEEIGDSCEFFQADVSKAEDWKRLEEHLGNRFNEITSVINAAGISEPATIEDETIEHWERVHAINGTSVFLGCQFAVKAMKERKGSIVNFASSLATRPKPFVISYNYSKAGVLILTRTVALHCAEMGYDIRCNAVQPGAINTPMMQRYVEAAENPDQQLSEFAASHPMNRVGEPDEVVSAVLFLASDDSAFTTGDSISVDGGVIAI